MKHRTEIISFRADESLLNRIDSARKPLVLSRGDLVREVIITHFHDHDDAIQANDVVAGFQHSLEQFDQRVERLETNQRRSLIILLTQLGVPLEQAKEIAKCRLSS